MSGVLTSLESSKAEARPQYDAPKHPTAPLALPISPQLIYFLHPGYPTHEGALLCLPGVDVNHGVHHRTALYACAMVANNRWDGFFTLDRDGAELVASTDMDQSLTVQQYYFQVPSPSHGELIASDRAAPS